MREAGRQTDRETGKKEERQESELCLGVLLRGAHAAQLIMLKHPATGDDVTGSRGRLLLGANSSYRKKTKEKELRGGK